MNGRDFNSPDSTKMRAIGAAIKLTIEHNGIAEHLRPHHALALWSEAAGDRVGSVTQAESVRGGILFVRAKSSVWANELTFCKPEILQKLNDRLGGEIIKDIRFHAGNRPERSQAPKKADKLAFAI